MRPDAPSTRQPNSQAGSSSPVGGCGTGAAAHGQQTGSEGDAPLRPQHRPWGGSRRAWARHLRRRWMITSDGQSSETDDFRVCGRSTVMDDHRVCCQSTVTDDHRVCSRSTAMDDRRVCSRSRVTDNHRVCSRSTVMDDHRVCGWSSVMDDHRWLSVDSDK